METIVVTGALGGIGSRVVAAYADRGHDVVGLDRRRPSRGRENVRFRAADLTDQGETWDAISQADPDAVLHFAGVRSGRMPRTRLFDVNVRTTHNVLTAAGEVGADAVWASSERAYGFPNDRIVSPAYLPIDEDHPRRPESAYGGSKTVGEDVAGMVARRYGVRIASVRATWVRFPGTYSERTVDPSSVTRETASSNFWSYVDVRDLVSFIDRYLDAPPSGHEAFNLAAADNHAGAETTALLGSALGTLPDRCAISGESSVYSTEKARERLGWRPEHDWRSALSEEPDPPSFLD